MKEIKYILRGVSVEQFATPFLPSLDDYDVNVSIPIKSNYQEHAIAIGANAVSYTHLTLPTIYSV